jgi:hypothetical protein
VRVGFRRLGIVLALVPLLVGVWLIISGLFHWVGPIANPPRFVVYNDKTNALLNYTYADRDDVHTKLKALFAPAEVPDDTLMLVQMNLSIVDGLRELGLATACFGALSIALAAAIYATLLADRLGSRAALWGPNRRDPAVSWVSLFTGCGALRIGYARERSADDGLESALADRACFHLAIVGRLHRLRHQLHFQSDAASETDRSRARAGIWSDDARVTVRSVSVGGSMLFSSGGFAPSPDPAIPPERFGTHHSKALFCPGHAIMR